MDALKEAKLGKINVHFNAYTCCFHRELSHSIKALYKQYPLVFLFLKQKRSSQALTKLPSVARDKASKRMSGHKVSSAEARKSKNEGRKRFTDKQISFLEYMYETQSRPELRMKHQLANKLGLHPRQVAIWFQNKRARSKSRQIEQEYNTLKHNYEMLASKSESLKKENQALLNQLEMLRNNVEKENTTGSSSGEESDDRVTNSPTKSDANVTFYSQEINVPFYDSVAFFGEENQFLDIEEQLCSVNDWEETNRSFGPDLQKWWDF